jgi:hypothetical protein
MTIGVSTETIIQEDFDLTTATKSLSAVSTFVKV